MAEIKTNNTTYSPGSDTSQSQSTNEETAITFINVPSNERANIHKGEDSKPLITKDVKE